MRKKKSIVKKNSEKKSCTPPVHINEIEHSQKTKLHKKRMQWIKKNWKMQHADSCRFRPSS